MPVRVVTDSSAVLAPDWIAEHAIHVVPLTLSWNGQDYRNGDVSYEEFERRASDGDIPKTSAPSPGHYQEAYEDALADADAIVCITPPAEVSATFSNATLAAQLVDPDRVTVVDSRSAVGGQGLVVLEAARAASSNACVEDVRQRASEVADHVELWATLEHLEYLRRSGRVPSVAAFASGALDLHPVFRFVDGSPSPVTASRGTKRAVARVLRAWSESVPESPAHCHLLIFHAAREEDAAGLRDQVADREASTEVHIVGISAAVAAHVGPGILGLAWWWEPTG